MRSASTFICAVFLLGCVDMVLSVRCYRCNSVIDSKCSDPFTSTGVDTCEEPQCYKSTGSATYNDTTVTVVVRDCLLVSTGRNECRNVDQDGVSLTVCTCSTNLCNSAYNSRQMSAVFPLLISLLTMMIVSIIRHQ